MCWFPLFIFFCYFFLLFFCFGHQFLIFSSTRERLYIYPQRPSGHAVGAGVIPNFMALSLFFFCFGRHSYLSAQLVRGFYPSDLLDKLWSQVPSPHPPPTPPRYILAFVYIAHAVQHSRRSPSLVESLPTRTQALSSLTE